MQLKKLDTPIVRKEKDLDAHYNAKKSTVNEQATTAVNQKPVIKAEVYSAAKNKARKEQAATVAKKQAVLKKGDTHLILKDVNKVYPNGFHAVHNFNISVKRGEFIVFVGPSGCGKSTTLRMIAGLEDISEGDFYISGKRANEKGPRERGVAMVFQSYALYPHMTVYDNLAFGLTLEGVDDELIEQRVMKTAKILGLVDYLDRMPRALSGGQRQRVAVGRAIIRHVEVFLMDEPLSNLDAKQRVTMRSEIIAIHKDVGATTVYVTHDQTEAMTMADRIVVMKDGYVQQVGTPYELYFKPVNIFVAGFIGEPPMNFIEGEIQNGVFRFNGTDVDITKTMSAKNIANYEGKKVVMGFRPEAAKLPEAVSANKAYYFDCDVLLTEMLGDSTNVYAQISGVETILKVDPHDEPEEDKKWRFAVLHSAVYWFDKATEKTIE